MSKIFFIYCVILPHYFCFVRLVVWFSVFALFLCCICVFVLALV
jgi:hypothetical protein